MGLAELALGWLRSVRQFVWPKQSERVQRHLRLVEVLNIGSHRQLLLVSCDGERFLVGTGADGVAALVRVHPDARVAPEPGGNGPTEPSQ